MIMQSHGGVAPIAESSRVAAGAVLSGPAGGVAAGTYAARLLGERNLITFDMGGTSTDIALLQNGEAQLTGEKRVGIAKVSLPALDIHTLGAGGGSIARVAGKILHVGPESAGADPGPGVLRPGRHGGDRDGRQRGARLPRSGELPRRAHRARCRRRRRRRSTRSRASSARAPSRRRRASPRSSTPTWRRASASSRSAAGVDPRRFTLVAFGGAAGLHVTEVARLLEIRRVVVPNVAAVLSAWGMLATDLRYEMVRSHVSEASRMTPAGLRQILAAHGGRGPRAARRLRGRDRGAALARHALRRADLRDQRADRRRRSGRARRDRRRSSRASTGATRSCTPTARRGRRSSSSTRGWP